MNTLFRLLIIYLGLLLPCAGNAQTNTQSRIDSLRHALNETEGKEKLRTYNRLAEIYFIQAQDDLKMDTLFAIYDEMEEEAIRQGKPMDPGTNRFNRLITYFNRREYEEVVRLAPEHMSYLSKQEARRYYFQIYDIYIKSYLQKGELELAIREAQKAYQEAEKLGNDEGLATTLFTMSKIYQNQRRNKEMEESLRQCIELIQDNEPLVNLLASAQFSLCQTLLTQQRHDEAMEVAGEYEKTIHRFEAYAKTPLPGVWANLWGVYARIYLKKQEFDLAESYCDKIDKAINSPTFQVITYTVRAQVHNHRGEYEKALEYADKGLAMTRKYTEESNGFRGIKIWVLSNMGRAKEAYELSHEAAAINDSIRNVEFARQIDDLNTQYEVYRHVAEKERQQLIIYWIASGCLVLLLLVIVFVLYSRKLYKKNLSLYKQINEQARLDKEAEEAKMQIPDEQLSRERKLFLKLQALMQSEKLFKDPDIDRNKLAEHLTTNRQYLTDAIRQETGLTFTNYLAELRIKYALELLTTRPDLSLDDVASESGHGSYSPFFRTFIQKYGMNPSEYRKFSNAKILEQE